MSGRFIDKLRLEVRGGRGGDGIVAYTAHKLKKLLGPGMPCGGNGGRGGDVSIIAKSSVRSLKSAVPILAGGNGQNGGKNRANGSPGRDVEFLVPLGVTIRDASTLTLLADLDQPDSSIVVARGGAGGRGNNMARPHESTPGLPGQDRRIFLELKTIADIGLVGFPNAGKSSLLSLLSRAAPKIAPYPFTTLAPHIGTVDVRSGPTDPDSLKSVKIADIPGLVEDAHLDRGMGHEFLRHIERTKALLFVIDSTCENWDTRSTIVEDSETEKSIQSILGILRNEICMYNDGMLSGKPWGVVCNKVDMVPDKLGQVDDLEKFLLYSNGVEKFSGCRGLVVTSAKHGLGKESVLRLIRRLLVSS